MWNREEMREHAKMAAVLPLLIQTGIEVKIIQALPAGALIHIDAIEKVGHLAHQNPNSKLLAWLHEKLGQGVVVSKN